MDGCSPFIFKKGNIFGIVLDFKRFSVPAEKWEPARNFTFVYGSKVEPFAYALLPKLGTKSAKATELRAKLNPCSNLDIFIRRIMTKYP